MKVQYFAFLPANERGWLLNLFNQAYRKGNNHPSKIINHVQTSITKYLSHPNLPRDKAKVLTAFLEALVTPEAIEYAEHVIRYEQLSPLERAQLKEAKQQQHKQEFLDKQLPTNKQLNYIKALGYQGQTPVNKAEASTLIDKLLSKNNGGKAA